MKNPTESTPRSVLHRILPRALLFSSFLVGSSAHGVIGVLTEYGGSEMAFDTTISTTDLVNSGAPSLASVSSTPLDAGALGYMHDGTFGWGTIREYWVPLPSSEYPATIDFNLDVVANPLGYQLTSLSTIAGGGVVAGPGDPAGREHEFAHQSYTVSYSLVGDPGFTPFRTVAALADPGDGQGTRQLSSKVTLVNIASVVPAGVDVVRFQWFDPAPSIVSSSHPDRTFTIIREIDVFGSAVQIPEPSSALLLALAGGIVFRRCRRS